MKFFNMEKDVFGFLFQSDVLMMEKVGSMFILLVVGIVVFIVLLVFDVCMERRVQVNYVFRFFVDLFKMLKIIEWLKY